MYLIVDRTEPVRIGRKSSPLAAEYVAPDHPRVPAAIDDLIAYVRGGDAPLLAQIAVAHAQFETIHPFSGGNGRAGRAPVQAMLRNKGLTRHVTVSVSAGLLADTEGYVEALTVYREGDQVPIVEKFAQASIRAIVNGRQLITELREIPSSWDARLTARSDSAVWKVADLLTRGPVVNSVLLRDEIGLRTDHSRRYLDPLAEAGIVVESSGRTCDRIWRAPEILDALDASAERAGRRG
ncbi:MAG: Fic family protein [Mycolicibacter sinensis]